MEVIECTKCGAIENTKSGMGWRAGERIQRYRCKVCGAVFVEPVTAEAIKGKEGGNIGTAK